MKKRNFLRILSGVLLLVITVTIPSMINVSAEDTTGTTYDGFEYKIENSEVTITGYSGIAAELIIPDTIQGHTVRRIGEEAFNNCDKITSVIVSDSIYDIGDGAFAWCDRLTDIRISDSVTFIGEHLFNGCSNLLQIKVDENNVMYDSRENCNAIIETSTNTLLCGCKNTIIPDTVTSLGYSALNTCVGLKEIVIPDSVVSIGDLAVYNCDSLTRIIIPDSVISIGDHTFKSCDNLSEIKVDENNPVYDSRNDCNAIVETSTNTLIQGCNNTVIPEGITTIGTEAFFLCNDLKSIVVPKSVTYIGFDAFDGCDKLTDVYFLGSEEQWNDIDIAERNENLSNAKIHFNCNQNNEPPEWKNLYIDYIENELLSGYCSYDRYDIVYLDDDNIPEILLFSSSPTLGSALLCISNGKVNIVDNIGYGDCLYIEREGLLRTLHIKMGIYTYRIYTLESEEFKEMHNGGAISHYDIQTDTEWFSCSWDGESVSQEEFNNKLEQAFDVSKATKATYNQPITDLPSAIKQFVQDGDTEIKDSIAVFTTEKSFSVKTGDSLWLAFGLIDGNGLIEDEEWSKMALVVSDDTVISLSDYEKTEYGYSIKVTGKREGSTNLTVTDTETGISTIIKISVYDMYSKTYSYPIEDMRVFYPNKKYEDHIATNIYNLNGIYVNNYTCEKNGSTYYVTFDAYNEKYHTGAVDVYDKNNRWIKSYEIEKFSDISGFWDTGEQLYYLASNTLKLFPGGDKSNFLTYEQESNSKHSHLSIEVPEDGYFTISNNIKESPGAYFYNTSELFFDAVVDFIDLGANGVESGDFAKIIMDEIQKDPTKQELLIELFKKTMEDELSEFAKNVMEGDIDEACSNLVVDYEDLLGALKIEWKHLFKSATGIGETAFEKVTGVYGMALSSMFKFNKGSSKMFQVLQFAESIDEPYVTVYANLDGDIVYNDGLIVDTNGNTDSEAVLQVFRVSNSDAIRVVLNSDNPLEQHEIYNICFVKDDKQVQPNGKVTVRIPIPQGMESDTCRVYRQENDGSWSALDAHVEGKYLVFETDHFSLYTIVGDMKRISVHTLPEKTTYDFGETLDTKGLIVEVDGELITNEFICSPSVLIGSGTQMITVRYGSAVTKFNVYVEGENTGNTTTTNPTEPDSKPIEIEPTESETAYLLGDVNDDGKVNIKDATMIQKAAAKIIELTDDEKLRADVNVDNKNNVKDATAIQKFVAKIETGFPIGEPID